MTKKIDPKKVGGVKRTTVAREVEGAATVQSVGGVKATTGVSGVKGGGAVGKRRSTRLMSLSEREELFRMVNEEAEKMFSSGAISPEHRQVVQSAVKMAIDAGMVEDDGENDQNSKKSGDK